MSQEIWASINPNTTSGTMLAAILTDFKDAMVSGFSGDSRPTQLQAGGIWIDTSLQASPDYKWILKLWTGTIDIEVVRINVNAGFGGAITSDSPFSIEQISSDTDPAILELIKNRIANNGQVFEGDTIGEVRIVGRDDEENDPVVAYIKWVSEDAETTTDSGGYLTFYSTPDASSTIIEHLKLISGLVETAAPHKLNALRLVPNIISTSATINQLSAANALIEFTGSTETQVRGINSGHDSKEVTIHNRSSAQVILKHQHNSATAADRIKLPSGDVVIDPDGSATLYYCTTDTRWKLKATQRSGVITTTIETKSGLINTWTAPSDVSKIRITGHRSLGCKFGFPFSSTFIVDRFGNMYAWGNSGQDLGAGDTSAHSFPTSVVGSIQFDRTFEGPAAALTADGTLYQWGRNAEGQLGVGDVTGRSSPVAVLGGLKFIQVTGNQTSTYGVTQNGAAYAWGGNLNGNLGVGDVAARSSPVAVLGGIVFDRIATTNCPVFTVNTHCVVGLDRNGAAYAWGNNVSGQLGVGDVTARSSPVAVLGGLTFKKVLVGTGTSEFCLGLTPSGQMYGWGVNNQGQLGVGDTTPRSSPVAVVGGLTFVDFIIQDNFNSVASVLALTADGTMYAWGANTGSAGKGNLGVGDIVARSSPVAVLGGLTWAGMHTQRNSTVAWTTDGTLYAWGQNDQGQLGLGDQTPRSSPVAVLGGLKFVWARFQDRGNACTGVTADGTIYAWGDHDGANGELTPRSSPIAVLGGFGMDTRTSIDSRVIEVEPGTTYNIYLPTGRPGYFGPHPLARAVDSITIEYNQRGA